MGRINISEHHKQILAEILKSVLLILLVLDAIIFFRVYFFQTVSVKGDSMNPSIREKDVLLINKAESPDEYKRYDVIVFKPYSEDDSATPDEDESEILYIKRIIGLPGETVSVLEDGSIQISDVSGKVSVLSDDIYGSSSMDRGINWKLDDDNIFETVTLADDEFFVLGDNRKVSLDSRSVKVQAVHKSSVLGRFSRRIFPFKR